MKLTKQRPLCLRPQVIRNHTDVTLGSDNVESFQASVTFTTAKADLSDGIISPGWPFPGKHQNFAPSDTLINGYS
ncbi:unnamed protein product [Ceratitis capitata]|uniref:(Mediterranean fruit fly) hypothetical protein n=1 Tax=Ceratitis capitata TaxID=7213 RepID=A0A811VJN1_CERCA|nr:unnamed protein product [Ceratitis capitata]